MSSHRPSPSGPADDDRTTLRTTPSATSPAVTAARRRRPVRLIVVGVAAALSVVLGVVGGSLVVGGQPSEPTASPTPTAPDPAAAVRGFLEAVGRGDAAAALGYAETQPADTSFITDDVLKAALATNAITEINVPPLPSSDTDSVSVDASYKIGGERVTESYDVNLVEGAFKLDKVAAELDVASTRSEKVPMVLAGREVDSDTVILLPGAYEVTSGLTFIDWGADNTIMVKSPGAFLAASKLALSINDAGTSAFRRAVKTSLDACVKIKKVEPTGCPFAYTSTSYTINPKTISWTLAEDPLADKVPRLDYEDDGSGTLSVSVSLRFKATGKSSYDGKSTKIDTRVYGSSTAAADLTGDAVKITWKF